MPNTIIYCDINIQFISFLALLKFNYINLITEKIIFINFSEFLDKIFIFCAIILIIRISQLIYLHVDDF